MEYSTTKWSFPWLEKSKSPFMKTFLHFLTFIWGNRKNVTLFGRLRNVRTLHMFFDNIRWLQVVEVVVAIKVECRESVIQALKDILSHRGCLVLVLCSTRRSRHCRSRVHADDLWKLLSDARVCWQVIFAQKQNSSIMCSWEFWFSPSEAKQQDSQNRYSTESSCTQKKCPVYSTCRTTLWMNFFLCVMAPDLGLRHN